jgi:hypothetical protein
VEGLGTAAIFRAAICPVRSEKFCDGTLKCGSRHVKSRIAGVKVMSDLCEKEVCCAVACSADFSPRRSQRGMYL